MALLALAGLLLLQTAPIPPTSRTFHDDGLHLTFTYPDGFVPGDTSKEITDALKTPDRDGFPSIPCITTPLFAIHHIATHQDELLLMLRLDFGCMGRQVGPEILPNIATNALKQGLTHVGQPILAKPVPYSLGKYDAVLVQGTAPDTHDGIPGHAAAACTLVVNTVLCWEVITAYPSHIAPLLASTVAFDKAAANPIVPAALIVVPSGPDPTTATK